MINENRKIKKVISSDGIEIAIERFGSGPALLLVHGAGADRSRWAGVLPQLAEHFTVYTMDRRGRGDSGDAADYAMQKEFDDVAAVAADVAEPVSILGHSFGAGCVLGAVPQIANLHALILYEPPMLTEQYTPERDGILRRMEEALAAGDRETVLFGLLNGIFHIPMEVIEKARLSPFWAGNLAMAPTILRELRTSDAYGANREALKTIHVPTLFLLGGESIPSFKVTTDTLHGLLPNSRVAVLPGQQHSAMTTAPALFASAVIRFLQEAG